MRHSSPVRATALLAWIAFWPLAALAQGAPSPDSVAIAPTIVPSGELNFTQTGIPAEATAGNAVLARDTAFASARRLAWDRMLEEAGLPPQNASPAQLDRLVSSIVIEQERVTPTRYSGRLTINFAANAVRGTVGRGGGGGTTSEPVPGVAGPPRLGPAALSIEASASYRSLSEWLDLRRRLLGAAPVASVDIQRIAVDGARLRLGLRQAPIDAAAELAGIGVALTSEPAPAPGGQATWRVRLAGGG